MKLKKIRLKNIRSYEDDEISFPEGSLLLSGDVGSGKTTILLAIEYALFGLQPGQRGAGLLRKDALFGEVALEFEVDGSDVLIERRLKRGGKNVTNDYAAITINGERSESSVTELKTKVLNLIGYPFEFIKKNNLLYKYTVYTPQENMKQIILEDSETRLNILRHTFGIEKYKRIRENLTIFINILKEESKILQVEIKNLDSDKSRLASLESLIEILELKIREKETELTLNTKIRKSEEIGLKELEEKLKERVKLESEVEKTKVLISAKEETLIQNKKERKRILDALSEISEEFNQEVLDEILKLISVKSEKIESLNSRYFELVSKINSFYDGRNERMEKKDRIFKIDICPTCLQDVPEAHKHNIMNEAEREIVEIKEKILFLEEQKSSLLDEIEIERVNLSEMEKRKTHLEILRSKMSFVQSSRNRIQELENSKKFLEKDISLLSKHMDDLKGSILQFSRYINLYRIKEESLKKSFIIEKNSEIELAELRKEAEMNRKEFMNLTSFILDKENSKQKLSETLQLLDWLSKQFLELINFIERNVMIKLRVEFSKLFKKWFNMLVTDDSFDIHLDENFTPVITQGESEMDYDFLSGGERTAVALAYRLALNQTINSIHSKIKTRDIVILDEPTDGFSDIQLDKVRDILEELNVKQLILVSHEQKIEGFVDNVLKLKKNEGASTSEIL